MLLIQRGLLGLMFIAELRLAYSLFHKKKPKQFNYIALLMLAATIITIIKTTPTHHNVLQYFIAPVVLIIWLEIFRIMYNWLKGKKEGAGILAAGFTISFCFSFLDTLIDNGVRLPTVIMEMENPYAVGTLVFLVTMSIHLAGNYSRTSRQLAAQERTAQEIELKRRLLEADNLRKTTELDEARKLQLSMLPGCDESLPGLDICFHMTTAVEVGGDYYDYRFEADNTFILTVGDATGHGMKAGVMTASMKSMFRAIGANRDIPAFFKQCTAIIKQMNMGNLFMALSVFRINRHHISFASAGMPPFFLLSKLDGEKHPFREVEEFRIKSPPLGAFSNFDYSMGEMEVKAGDILIIMSDGLPELFDESDQMLGYENIKEILKTYPGDSPEGVINHIKKAADLWRRTKEQDDDLTLVAVKIKESNETGQLRQGPPGCTGSAIKGGCV